MTTQLATDLPPYAPLKAQPEVVAWMGFEAGTSRAEATAGFFRKYGKPPERVQVHYIVMAGPIEDGG